MNSYQVRFDFTTAHKNGKFVGRSGHFVFETDDDSKEVHKNISDIENLCAQFIHHEKPKWNILMITVKQITQLQNQQNT